MPDFLPPRRRPRAATRSAVVPCRARAAGPSAVEPLESRQLLTVIAGFAETLVAGGLTQATKVTVAPDGRLFVSLQGGQVRIVKNGELLSAPFATFTVQNFSERGLMGLAFDPNFATNNYVYAYHSTLEGGAHNRVTRVTASGDTIVPGSAKVLFDFDPLGDSGWHNGGAIEFGKDGKLYVAVGENNWAQDAQMLANTRGKVLRLNPDGTIPTDNPFYSRATGKAKAIWALGLRNPFSMDVQPGTGRMMIGDVGAGGFEEINEGKAGANYGWPRTEGPTSDPAYQTPFYSYPHDFGKSAITGVNFYNPADAAFGADYVGDVFYADYNGGFIKRVDTGNKSVKNFVTNVPQISDTATGPDGTLYYVTRANGGQLFRVRPTTSSAPSISVQPADQTVAVGQSATFAVSAGGSGLSYQWQRNGVNVAGANAATYTRANVALADNGATFRCVVTNTAGSATTRAAVLTVIDDEVPTATIDTPGAGTLWTAGQTINFSGTGTDPEDGTLPASAFSWEVVFHHDTHTHPFVAPTSGSKTGSFTIPTVGEADPDVWYRIHLTVKDSRGLTSQTFRDAHPQKVNLSLRTEPAGLGLELDDQPVATPYASPAVVGLTRKLGAPATRVKDGVVYEFDGWSDGGAREHEVATPSADVIYTARYKVSTQQSVTLSPVADAYVRDGTYAAQNFGAAAEMQMKNGASSYTRHGYMKFDLSQLGAVTSAKLRVFARLDNTQAASVPVSVFAGPDGWTEPGITWNNKPASGATALKSFTVTGITGNYYEVDLTAYLQQKQAAGATVATVVLKGGVSSNSTVLIASDEAAANKPQLVVLASGASPGPDPGPTTPVRVASAADAYVRDGVHANSNFGGDPTLVIKRSNNLDWTREAYLRFDLSGVASVTAAKLRLFGRLTGSAASGAIDAAVYGASDTSWSESGITHANRPLAATAALATTSLSGVADRWYEWDLTAFLQTEKAAGRSVVTLVVKSLTLVDASAIFNSDEAATNRPELLVTS